MLFGEGFLCGGHSLDKLGNFDVVFMGPSGGEWDKEDSFEH